MALFKPFRGNRTALDAQPLHDGYAYFCVDDGSFHIDYTDADGNLQRKQLNAKEAETLGLHTADEFLLKEEIDQTYNPESSNAQSGVAVADAIAQMKETYIEPLESEINEDVLILKIDLSKNVFEENKCSVNLNLNSTATRIDWGDGTINSEQSHIYPTLGKYTIKVYGNVTIQYYAFEGQFIFTNVVIPSYMSTIGEYAFQMCTNLKTIEFKNSTPIDYQHLLEGCASLEKIIVPNDSVEAYKTAWSDVADKITAIAYLNDLSNNFVDLTSFQSISGQKQFNDGVSTGANTYLCNDLNMGGDNGYVTLSSEFISFEGPSGSYLIAYKDIAKKDDVDNAIKSLMGGEVDEAYDTFKEWQDIIVGDESGAAGLITQINQNSHAIKNVEDTYLTKSAFSSFNSQVSSGQFPVGYANGAGMAQCDGNNNVFHETYVNNSKFMSLTSELSSGQFQVGSANRATNDSYNRSIYETYETKENASSKYSTFVDLSNMQTINAPKYFNFPISIMYAFNGETVETNYYSDGIHVGNVGEIYYPKTSGTLALEADVQTKANQTDFDALLEALSETMPKVVRVF